MAREDIMLIADKAKLTCVMEMFQEELERFAALIAAAEREACATLCESLYGETPKLEQLDCATAIRERESKAKIEGVISTNRQW